MATRILTRKDFHEFVLLRGKGGRPTAPSRSIGLLGQLSISVTLDGYRQLQEPTHISVWVNGTKLLILPAVEGDRGARLLRSGREVAPSYRFASKKAVRFLREKGGISTGPGRFSWVPVCLPRHREEPARVALLVDTDTNTDTKEI